MKLEVKCRYYTLHFIQEVIGTLNLISLFQFQLNYHKEEIKIAPLSIKLAFSGRNISSIEWKRRKIHLLNVRERSKNILVVLVLSL